MVRIRVGIEPSVMTVAQPAAVASSAAISLVSIPPVPSEDPSVEVLTVWKSQSVRDLPDLATCDEVPGQIRLTQFPYLLDIADFGHSPRSGDPSRVVFVQAVDVRHQEEVVGAAHAGGDGRQGIVVAKLVDVQDFGDGDGVVLVDDGDDTEGEQSRECRCGVEISRALQVEHFESVLCGKVTRASGPYVGNVVPRHEDLCDGLLKSAKDLIPQRDQPSLTDSGEGLLFSDRAFLARLHGRELHAVQAHADGTGRDDDDAVSEGAEGYACLCEGREGRDLREMRRVRLQDGR